MFFTRIYAYCRILLCCKRNFDGLRKDLIRKKGKIMRKERIVKERD